MLSEGAGMGKSSLTHVALEWLFPCVGVHVLFQSTWTGEFIPTLLALEMQHFLHVGREMCVQWMTRLVSL